MLTDILLGAMSVAVAGGISALVFYRKNGNGKHEPNPWRYAPDVLEKLGPPQQQAPAPVEVKWPPELAAALSHITQRLETALERAEHPLVVRESGEPEWSKQVFRDLEHINDRLSEPAVLPEELTVSLGRVTDRLETLLSVPPKPDLEPTWLGQVERITNQLDEILKAKLSDRLPVAPPEDMPIVRPGGGGGTGGGVPVPFVVPPPPLATDITLGIFNTLTLVADEVYTLLPPERGVYQINLANIGPGNLYIRAGVDPAPGDPRSELLPSGSVDNEIAMPVNLRVLADADTVVSVRLQYQM